MSWFEKVWTKVKSIFSKDAAPSWIQSARSAVAFAAPLVVNIVENIDASAGTQAATIADEVKTGLAAISVALDDAANGNGGLADLPSILGSVQKNIGLLLQVARVKNSATQTSITNWANLIIGEINAISTVLPSATAAAASTATAVSNS